jgi:hypothetical protein
MKFVPPSGAFVSSNFLLGSEEWQIVGNRAAASPASFEAFTRGNGFSNYIFGTDDTINTDSSGKDASLWYFQAPAKFHGNFGLAYGGLLTFSLAAFSGDTSQTNGEEVDSHACAHIHPIYIHNNITIVVGVCGHPGVRGVSRPHPQGAAPGPPPVSADRESEAGAGGQGLRAAPQRDGGLEEGLAERAAPVDHRHEVRHHTSAFQTFGTHLHS